MRIDWIRALIYQRPGLDITARVAKTLNYQQSHQNLNHFKVDESWRSNVWRQLQPRSTLILV